MPHPRERQWLEHAAKHLVGRRIVSVAYISEKEAEAMGWSSRPIAFKLDNGTTLFPQSDEEGNDGGHLAGIAKDKSELDFPPL